MIPRWAEQGPTSALTQFARCTAAYLRGFQNTYGVSFYAISLQNELDFEEFYNSCLYPLSSNYTAALKAVRAELDQYPDLAGIKIMGPEDVLGGDAYGMWQYGSGSTTTDKNLQFLQGVGADPVAAAAEAFFCIHGYDSDGVSAADATPTQWDWWANGWGDSPAAGIPANVPGFASYGKKSWMTETSGENTAWLSPTNGFPDDGAWSIALRIQQALTAGQESAWAYWQMTDGSAVGAETLTDAATLQNSPKYVAAKHFFRYIRPNSICVNATVSGSATLSACAFLHPTNGTMTIVLINSTNTPAQADDQLARAAGGDHLVANFHLEQRELLAGFDERDRRWLRGGERAGIRRGYALWDGATGAERRVGRQRRAESVLAAERERVRAAIHDQRGLVFFLGQCRQRPHFNQWADEWLGQRDDSAERRERLLPAGATVTGRRFTSTQLERLRARSSPPWRRP